MTSTLAIQLANLQFSWPGKAPLLSIDSWQLNAGERCFIYGRSGSGKSTLLNLIAGILLPQEGSVSIHGTDLATLSARQRDQFRAQNMGVIFQQFNLLPYLSVADNIQLSQHFSKRGHNETGVVELLASLELPQNILQKPARELSVGQQQRVAVARALIHQPKLIIADEPTSALDEKTRNKFMELLTQRCQLTHCSLVFVSHEKTLAHHFDQQLDLHTLNQAGEQYVT